jgi:hypothetical protein
MRGSRLWICFSLALLGLAWSGSTALAPPLRCSAFSQCVFPSNLPGSAGTWFHGTLCPIDANNQLVVFCYCSATVCNNNPSAVNPFSSPFNSANAGFCFGSSCYSNVKCTEYTNPGAKKAIKALCGMIHPPPPRPPR